MVLAGSTSLSGADGNAFSALPLRVATTRAISDSRCGWVDESYAL